MAGDEKQYQLPTITGAALPATATFPLLNPEDTTTPPADAHGSQQQITRAELAIALGISLADTDTFLQSVVAGANITINNADPANPIISSSGAGGAFPVGPHDDSTATGLITATGAALTASETLDANAGDVAELVLAPDADAATATLESLGRSGGVVSVSANVGVPGASLIQFRTDSGFTNLYVGSGNPNTVVSTGKGSLFVDTTGPALWQNTDGATTWAQLGSGATGHTGLYGSSPSPTSIPTGAVNTALTWPTLTGGTSLLDLTAPTVPTVLTDGTYTFNVTTQSGTPGTDFEIAVQATSGIPFTGGEGSTNKFPGTSLTAFLTAGTSIEVLAQQNSGGAVNLSLTVVTVTRIT